MKKLIHKAPNWLYEAASCIAKEYKNDENSIIENHNSFGLTMDEITEKLAKYTAYYNVVTAEIKPIYKRYLYLEKFFKEPNFSEEINNPIALSLVIYFGDYLTPTLSYEKIDEIVKEYISNIIIELSTDIEEKKVSFNSLEDILNSLDKSTLEDAYKLQLVNLYHNRYEIITKLSELLHLCSQICEKHFPLISEDFNKSVEFLYETSDLKPLLYDLSGGKLNIPLGGEIYSSIIGFNQLSMIEVENSFRFYIGIYFFDYMKLKYQNRFNDTQIVSDLKALGDPTRLKIIHLLSTKKMYIQELSDVLELTPATVSHHINILLKSELISITVEVEKAKKVYYEANFEKIKGLGETIKSLVPVNS